ncbi:sigma-70 family RNA polymerase sigma factor [Feifania hominis]|uniref:Sigma-70 family RNA polymerase sigma factor n=1 Tax=Feifania hominis TaxID=2763660 RepID=A0A926DFB4_9FIRM|nr:sigma-70 family RNA polymerase sigma factor [Feifania hominis]MBC8536234.1 sigma-70 family RNA polymerase sigma factor [Feifania hominis]
MDDDRLLERMQCRDEAALAQLIDRYAGYVAAIVRRVLGPGAGREEIEEAVSDIFFALWEAAGRIDRDGTLRYYLAAIARNTAKNRLRKLGRTPEIPLDEDTLEGLSGAQDPLADRLQAQALREAIGEMGPPDSEIFIRRYFYFEKVAEIAQRLGMNPKTVQTRLCRGREKLRIILNRRGEPL